MLKNFLPKPGIVDREKLSKGKLNQSEAYQA